MYVLDSNKPLKVNGQSNIRKILLYHIRKYVDKNFSCMVLVLDLCTLGDIEEGSLDFDYSLFIKE